LDRLPYLRAYLDPGRHSCSIYSLDTGREEDLDSSSNLSQITCFDDIDRWLFDPHAPFTFCNWPLGFKDCEVSITSRRKAILEEISDFEEILNHQSPMHGCFKEFPSQQRSASPELYGIGDHHPVTYDPYLQIEQESSNAMDHRLDNLLSLEMTLAEYQYKCGETATPTLKQHFQLAKALEDIGNHNEAEYHCRKIIDQHSQIEVETFFGIMLAKTSRMEESMGMLARAMTGFIVHFKTNSFHRNIVLFEQIEILFTKLLGLIEHDTSGWSLCLCRLMATLSSTSSDASNVIAQIHPQLYIHGFSLAYEYSHLGLTKQAGWMYLDLLQNCSEHLDIVNHAIEKAKAHREYGLILREQQYWRSSAHQLRIACKSAKHSVLLHRDLCRTLESDYLELLPHMEKTVAARLRESLDSIQPEISFSMRDIFKLIGCSIVDEYPISSLNLQRSALSQIEQFIKDPETTEPKHTNEELTTVTSTTTTSMAGKSSNDRSKSWSDDTWDEYARLGSICNRIATSS
jgi:hypothetical protein